MLEYLGLYMTVHISLGILLCLATLIIQGRAGNLSDEYKPPSLFDWLFIIVFLILLSPMLILFARGRDVLFQTTFED